MLLSCLILGTPTRILLTTGRIRTLSSTRLLSGLPVLSITQRLSVHKSRVTTLEVDLPANQGDDPGFRVKVSDPPGAAVIDDGATAASGLRERMLQMFLPKGFPQSVSDNYRSYSAWHFAHLTAGTVTGGWHHCLPSSSLPRHPLTLFCQFCPCSRSCTPWALVLAQFP